MTAAVQPVLRGRRAKRVVPGLVEVWRCDEGKLRIEVRGVAVATVEPLGDQWELRIVGEPAGLFATSADAVDAWLAQPLIRARVS